MSEHWATHDTSRHQDHVIAHVIGATVLAYFVIAEAAYLLTDIGFIWTIFLDGEMGLVPQGMAISELDADEGTRSEISGDIDLLQRFGVEADGLRRMKPLPTNLQIIDVELFATGDRRLLKIKCEGADIDIETSLGSGNIMLSY